MRERGGGLTMFGVVAAIVVLAKVKDTTATPAAASTRHQPSGPTMKANHVEDEFLDDALGEWLNNFDTYTFMVKQDLDAHDGDTEEGRGGEGGHEEDTEAAVEEERQREWSAPIAVSVGSEKLLDPRHDHLVTVESLVAEEGSIFLTLSKYNNETDCGVGGLSVEVGLRDPPRGTRAEEEVTPPDTSGWVEVSENYWWARGRLSGGAVLSITFTPPECGCLALNTYYALPVGNLTLVVGPQAYPDELLVLLCIDPLASIPDHEEEEEESVADFFQEPSALVASRNPGEDEAQTEAEAEESPGQPTTVPMTSNLPRDEKKTARKTMREMKRKRIRLAGRHQARQQSQQQDEERRSLRRSDRRRLKKRTKKVWKKVEKGMARRRRLRKKHRHHDHQENVNSTAINGTNAEGFTDHHPTAPFSTSLANQALSSPQHEERLIDKLLRDPPEDSSTTAEGQGSTPGEDTVGEGDHAAGEEEGEGGAALTPRERRKKLRQRKRLLRKERKNAYPPGIKFCCKQGVKHKKNILGLNSTSENEPESCNMPSDVVSTFANHQFGIEADVCSNTYIKCCTRLTAELWNSIKARKMARRIEKQQRRKSRRKQRRRNERRMRKMHKHADHQDVGEEDAAMDLACIEEGDEACEHTN